MASLTKRRLTTCRVPSICNIDVAIIGCYYILDVTRNLITIISFLLMYDSPDSKKQLSLLFLSCFLIIITDIYPPKIVTKDRKE